MSENYEFDPTDTDKKNHPFVLQYKNTLKQRVVFYMFNKAEAFSDQRIFKTTVKFQNTGGRKFLKKLLSIITSENIIPALLGFFLGRASILGGLSPFGLAYIAAVSAQRKKVIGVAVFTILGFLSSHWEVDSLRYIISAVLFVLIYMVVQKKLNGNGLVTAALMFEISLVTSLIIVYFQGFILYDVIVVSFESLMVFLLSYIFFCGLPCFLKHDGKEVSLTDEKIVAIIILLGIVLSGFEIKIYGASVSTSLQIFVILMVSYIYGASIGPAGGAILGVLNSLMAAASPMLIGVYSFAGLMSGIFNTMGKIGVIVGFIGGSSLLTYYINHFSEIYVPIKEVFVASLVFLAIPRKTMNLTSNRNLLFSGLSSSISGFHSWADGVFSEKVRCLASLRLKEVSYLFEDLSCIFAPQQNRKGIIEKNNLEEIFAAVMNKVCNSCSLYKTCWEKDFYKTYQQIFDIISLCENKKAGGNNLPISFSKRCLRTEKLVDMINSLVEACRINYQWQKKVADNQELVAEQLKSISRIMADIADEIKTEVIFRRDLEEKIINKLKTIGVEYKELLVMENPGYGLEINLEKTACKGDRDCITKILPAVSEAVGDRMVIRDSMCGLKNNKNICRVRLNSAEVFEVAVGVATMPKNRNQVSGDTNTFRHLRDGRYLLAISDGMGVGSKALKESDTAISLLERLLETGFKEDVAVKTINSVLLHRSREETFSTIDMGMVNLYNGEINFVKAGSCTSFIKRENSVEAIKSESLPAGILNSVEVEKIKKKLKPGDIVIMMSDGLIDSVGLIKNDPEKWISEKIKSLNTRNPQELADTLLNDVLTLTNFDIRDDITILAAKLWERRLRA